jgi:hypothetical protein
MVIMMKIYVFGTNVDSDCNDENVVVKSVCKDKSVKVLWYNNVRTYHDTGRFIMYSGNTKICYRKTVGHVFMFLLCLWFRVS